MEHLKVGDVFSISTPKGDAYFQYVYNNPDLVELLRILPGIYTEEPNIKKIINLKELFLIHFPIKAAYNRGIVKLIGNEEIPVTFELPKKMRAENTDSNGNIVGWQIVDFDTWTITNLKNLKNSEIQLSPWEIWDDTLLIERITAGWTLEKWI